MLRLLRRPKFIYLILSLVSLLFLFHSSGNIIVYIDDHSIPYHPTTPPPRILLVSAYYHSSHAKHSDYAYTKWLKRYLGHITTDIYFFTSPDLESFIRSIRPTSFPLYLNTSFPTPFSIPPLHNLTFVYSTQQHDLDPEKEKHSPDVYAIWNGKPYFVTQAVQNLERQGKVYDYVFWNDAGSFRDEHWYSKWPDPRRVEQVWTEAAMKLNGQSSRSATDLVFFPIADMLPYKFATWKESHGPIKDGLTQGSFFGGSPSAMIWFSDTFYAYHDYYLSKSFFVGIDQDVFNTLFLLFPERFIAMDYRDAPLMDIDLYGACCWRWWYYHFWLGDEKGGEKVRKMWSRMLKQLRKEKAKEVVWWKAFFQWVKGESVPSRKRMAPVKLITSVFRREFGESWTPPERHVHVESRGRATRF